MHPKVFLRRVGFRVNRSKLSQSSNKKCLITIKKTSLLPEFSHEPFLIYSLTCLKLFIFNDCTIACKFTVTITTTTTKYN